MTDWDQTALRFYDLHASSGWAVSCGDRNYVLLAGGRGFLKPTSPASGVVYEAGSDVADGGHLTTHVVQAPTGVGDLTVTAMTCQTATLHPAPGPDLHLDMSTVTFTGKGSRRSVSGFGSGRDPSDGPRSAPSTVSLLTVPVWHGSPPISGSAGWTLRSAD